MLLTELDPERRLIENTENKETYEVSFDVIMKSFDALGAFPIKSDEEEELACGVG